MPIWPPPLKPFLLKVGEPNATALGQSNTASGLQSTALGVGNIASKTSTTALGDLNTASGIGSTAVGQKNTANRTNATALGRSNTASGLQTRRSASATLQARPAPRRWAI